MLVVKHSDYDVNELSFEPINTTAKKKNSQTLLLPIYKSERSPMIQLPYVKLDMYGIPSKCDFFKDDYQRHFIKLPLNTVHEDAQARVRGEATHDMKNLYDWFKAIDDKFGTKEFQEQLFKKKNPKAKYQPLLRIPKNEDETESTDKLPYVKIKLTSKYPTNEILTGVVLNHPSGLKEVAQGITTIDDIAKYIKYQSRIKCIIIPSKLWIHPPANNDVTYGISFKLLKVLVDIVPEKSLISNDTTGFIESDESDDE